MGHFKKIIQDKPVEFLQTVLINIKNSFLNNLTSIQIGDIVINRLKTESYDVFINHVIEKCDRPKEI